MTLVFVVEPIVFVTPLEDVTLEEVGLKAVFETIITKEGMKAEWFKVNYIYKFRLLIAGLS